MTGKHAKMVEHVTGTADERQGQMTFFDMPRHGHRAFCYTCPWNGPFRLYKAQAEKDGERHKEVMSASS